MINYVYYHSYENNNCLDGIASAYVAKKFLSEKYNDVYTIPATYGSEYKIFDDINRTNESIIDNNFPFEINVYFVDFCLSRDDLIKLSKLVNKIIIIDHHKTHMEEVKNLPNNVEVNFDENSSGCILTYRYFINRFHNPLSIIDTKNLLDKLELIEDRDIWKWKLGVRTHVWNTFLQNNIAHNNVDGFCLAIKEDEETVINYSKHVNHYKGIIINNSLKNLNTLIFEDVEFIACNATNLISEIGNNICKEYNRPAFVYSVDGNNVIVSLRSLNHLDDVGEIAKRNGGGGHRNASGFKMSISKFLFILSRYESKRVN